MLCHDPDGGQQHLQVWSRHGESIVDVALLSTTASWQAILPIHVLATTSPQHHVYIAHQHVCYGCHTVQSCAAGILGQMLLLLPPAAHAQDTGPDLKFVHVVLQGSSRNHGTACDSLLQLQYCCAVHVQQLCSSSSAPLSAVLQLIPSTA